MDKTKGFTLLELMIVVAIIAILSTVATVSMKGRSEKNAKIKVKNMIPMFLNNAIDRAFDEGKGYILDMSNINNASDPRIEMGTRKVNLPSILDYEIVEKGTTVILSSITINQKGEFNKEFVISVEDKQGLQILTVSGININEINLGKIIVE